MLDQKYTGVIRHAIEFYGTKPTIPTALKSFRSFLYNQDRARISFITAPGTGFKNLTKIYSTDPEIQRFNSIFSAANQNINWKLVKTYDFADTANPPQYTPPVAPIPRPNPTPILPINKKEEDIVIGEDSSSLVPIFIVVVAGLMILKKIKTSKKRR